MVRSNPLDVAKSIVFSKDVAVPNSGLVWAARLAVQDHIQKSMSVMATVESQ